MQARSESDTLPGKAAGARPGGSPRTAPPGGSEPLIAVRNVTRVFAGPAGAFPALRDVSFEIDRGRMFAIVGKSGSGKSTLLNILTGIDHPTAGTVRIAGTTVQTLPESALARWRGVHVGVVFQFFQLLPTLTILENVMLPMDFCHVIPMRDRQERALELLETVGIRDQADKFPAALSGGQQQRAAIARALANDPPVLVADEPTGNLDSQTAESIFTLFRGLADRGKTILVVTHETAFARFFEGSIRLHDGRLIDAAGEGGEHAARS